ncbi:hypothetical protein ACUY3S_06265 [Corynebacterium resistens]
MALDAGGNMDSSFLGGNVWFFGAIFILIIVSFLPKRKPSKKRRIGVGQILSMRIENKRLPTSKQLVTFQVAVEPEHGAPFQDTFTHTVTKERLPLLQPGIMFPLTYKVQHVDSSTPDTGTIKGISSNSSFHEQAKQFFNHVRIRDGVIDQATLHADYNGEPAQAQIENIFPTGRQFRGLREFQLALTVHSPNVLPYQVTKNLVLLEFEAAAAQPGTIVPARIIPHSPDAIAISLRPKI